MCDIGNDSGSKFPQFQKAAGNRTFFIEIQRLNTMASLPRCQSEVPVPQYLGKSGLKLC